MKFLIYSVHHAKWKLRTRSAQAGKWQKRAFWSFSFFFFASSFIQRLCGAFRSGCNEPKSE